MLFIVEYQEENFIDRILLDEAERVLSRAPGDVPGGLIRYIVRTPEDGAALPEYLRELGPGLHEFYIGEREFHVDVQPTQDGVYYLLYDATRHEDRVNEFRIFMLFGVAVSIAVLVWAGIWVAGRLVRQVTDLSRRVAKLDPAVAQPVLAPDYRDAEVVTLAQALDEYADRVAELLGREKEFTANVSHELRTPLTIIKSSCELLLNDASLNEKSRSRIQRVLEGTDRMVEVVEALLLLAREAPMAARESVALHEMVSEIAAQFDSALEAKGISLEIDIPEGAALSVHRTALSLLIGNLLKNALIYTDHGRI
ncbi:MAG TPA: HAMP domain-containing sensor histidine kinase, partial [Steroidobacteraceae bacterium]|nr:HAMP domain-containing sensor histidine kinase [Steroidobacteraceae bacterium]